MAQLAAHLRPGSGAVLFQLLEMRVSRSDKLKPGRDLIATDPNATAQQVYNALEFAGTVGMGVLKTAKNLFRELGSAKTATSPADETKRVLEAAKHECEKAVEADLGEKVKYEREIRIRQAIDAMRGPLNPTDRRKKLSRAEIHVLFAKQVVELARALDEPEYADRLAELAKETSQDDKERALVISLLRYEAKVGDVAKLVGLLEKIATDGFGSRVHHLLCTFDELLWKPTPDDYFHSKVGSFDAELKDATGDDWQVIRQLSRELFSHLSFPPEPLAQQLKNWLRVRCRNVDEYHHLRIPDVRKMLEQAADRELKIAKKGPSRRGRKSDTNHEADRRIYDGWKASGLRTHEEYATKNGYKESEVKKALDRHKKRLAKSKE